MGIRGGRGRSLRLAARALVATAVVASVTSCALLTDLSDLSSGSGASADAAGAETASAVDASGSPDSATADVVTSADGNVPIDAGKDADAATPSCTTTAVLGPRTATVAENRGTGETWELTDRALTQDDLGSSSLLTATATESKDLVFRAFGFAIPAGARVKGVRVEVRRRSEGGVNFRDREVKLVVGNVATGDDFKSSTKWPSSYQVQTYGDLGETWGADIEPSQVNATDFGVSIRARYDSAAGGDKGEIDVVRMTVAYCP